MYPQKMDTFRTTEHSWVKTENAIRMDELMRENVTAS
jgi:hypothetical protein